MDDNRQRYQKIILASASPRRKELLERHSISFDVIPASIAECESGKNPISVCAENARAKALFVAQKNSGRIVLGADTIVVLDGVIYGKPKDKSDAVRILQKLRGRTHSVFTAISLVKVSGEKKLVRDAVCESRVSFKNIGDAEIAEYMSKVNVMDKAGAYAAQEEGSLIISGIDGDFENVMGLPCALLMRELETFERTNA